MKKKWIVLLIVVFLLSGCSTPESTDKPKEHTTVPAAQSEILQTLPSPEPGVPTQPTEPELPWPADVRWYSTYYFEKSNNPDPNIVPGVVRFNSLLRNESRETLTIISAHADFYLGTDIVAQEDYDSKKLPDFFFHPGVGNLKMEYGESKVFQVYSTTVEKGTYDRVIVTFTIADSDGSEYTEKFHFAVHEEDITPYSFADRTDWSPVSLTEERWDFHMFPENTTEETLEYVGMYVTIFKDGLPMSSDFFGKSKVNPKALKDIQTLEPGQMVHYQEGITHRYNMTDQREHTMVYKNDAGELFLQTFHFALDEEAAYPDPFPIYNYIYSQSGITVLDTSEEVEQQIGKSRFTRQEIRQMIDEGLTLDDFADRLSNIHEVQLFLLESGIKFSGSDIKKRIDGTLWHFSYSPETVFRQNFAGCGSGSNLVNHLLQGDYDEQGYLMQTENMGSHIFNYFRSGNRYYIFDWKNISQGRYEVFITDSLEAFADAYVRANHAVEDRTMHHRILLLYAYPYAGTHRPMGDGIITPKGKPLLHVVPAEIQEMVITLYAEKEEYAPVFVETPPVSKWPGDAQ